MLDAFTRVMRKPQQALAYMPGIPVGQSPLPATRLRREPDGPVSMRSDAETDLHVPSPFRVGYDEHLIRRFNLTIFSLLSAISADRRGIEPDHYVFQVPEHEESPLGPLTLNDRRGNIRNESSFLFR